MMLASRFRVMCSDAGLSIEAVAQALQVTTRTVRYWFSAKSAVPYSAYRLVRILGRFELPDPAWKGWIFHSGRLWSPEGHGFVPTDSNWWGRLVSQARLWREDHERGRQFDVLMVRTGAAGVDRARGPTAPVGPVGMIARDYAGLEARARAEFARQASGRGVVSVQPSLPPDQLAASPPGCNTGGKSTHSSLTATIGIQSQPVGAS